MAEKLLHLVWLQAWQLAILTALVAVAARSVGRRRSHLMFALLLLVLVKSVTPPVWQSTTGMFSQLQRLDWPLVATSAEPVPATDFATDRLLAMPPTVVVVPEQNKTRSRSELVTVVVDEAEPAVAETPIPTTGDRFGFDQTIMALLLISMAVGFIRAVWRWMAFRNRLRNSTVEAEEDLVTLIEGLRQRLGVRRRVTACVTSLPLGPAIIGLWRPTVIIPRVLCERLSPRELESILAHELMHVRRGDLCVAYLQLTAATLWWFHPAVRWANRSLTNVMERCCDADVIAVLKCPPGNYARSLLAVLELRQEWIPTPPVPGIRKIDLTAERLERIMHVDHGGSRMRTWINRLVFVIGLALVLPGGRGSVGEEPNMPAKTGRLLYGVGVNSDAGVTGTIVLDETICPPANQSHTPSRTTRTAPKINPTMWGAPRPGTPISLPGPPHIPAAGAGPAPFRHDPSLKLTTYPNTNLISLIQRQAKVDEQTAHRLLEAMASEVLWNFDVASANSNPQPVPDVGRRHRVSSKPGRLIVSATSPQRAQLSRELKLFEEAGGWYVVRIDGSLFAGNFDDLVKDLPWQTNEASNDAPPAKNGPATWHDLAQADTHIKPTQTETPAMVALMKTKRFEELSTRLHEADRRMHMLSTPTVVTWNGRAAQIQSGTIRPFVVGVQDDRPVVKNFEDGWKCEFTPEVREDEVLIHAVLQSSNIAAVNLLNLPGSEIRVQVPTTSVSRVTAEIALQPGETALIGGLTHRIEGEDSKPLWFAVQASASPIDLVATYGAAALRNVVADSATAETVPPAVSLEPAPYSEDAAKSSSSAAAKTVAQIIAHKLGQPIHVRWYDVTLGNAIRDVARLTGTNIVVDAVGLQEVGVTLEAKDFSIEMEGVSARTALRLLLEPLGLETVIRDEVIVVTSRERAHPLTVVTYAVADLVIPISTDFSVDAESDPTEAATTTELKADPDPLMTLLKESIAPDSWREAGGSGNIAFHNDTLALVVRQTEQVHAEIADLLGQLRRLHDVTVQLDVERWTVTADDAAKLKLSESQRLTTRMQQALLVPADGITALPKATLFNGQQCNFRIGDDRSVTIQPIISADRREVQVTMIQPIDEDSRNSVSTVRANDGQALLYLVEISEDEAIVLRVIPRIIVAEEEEELLGLPATGEGSAQIRLGFPEGMRLTWMSETEKRARPLTESTRMNCRPKTAFRLYGEDESQGREWSAFGSLEFPQDDEDAAIFRRHNLVPLQLTNEDVDQITTGNVVTKVLYLKQSDWPVNFKTLEVLVSTRLDPGLDPVAEAEKRGNIVAVLRLSRRADDVKLTAAAGAEHGNLRPQVGGAGDRVVATVNGTKIFASEVVMPFSAVLRERLQNQFPPPVKLSLLTQIFESGLTQYIDRHLAAAAYMDQATPEQLAAVELHLEKTFAREMGRLAEDLGLPAADTLDAYLRQQNWTGEKLRRNFRTQLLSLEYLRTRKNADTALAELREAAEIEIHESTVK